MSASNPTSPAGKLIVDGQHEAITENDFGSPETINDSFNMSIEELGMPGMLFQ